MWPRRLECLDLLVDLLRRFGRSMEQEHAQISQQTLRQLNHELQSVRKTVGSKRAGAQTIQNFQDVFFKKMREEKQNRSPFN